MDLGVIIACCFVLFYFSFISLLLIIFAKACFELAFRKD